MTQQGSALQWLENDVLLIVDDEERALRAMALISRGHFAEVYTARNQEEAEQHLAAHVVTHLLCDHWLGDASELGVELVRAWRTTYPSIRRAVIITGTDTHKVAATTAVDAVLSKTISATELVSTLKEKGP